MKDLFDLSGKTAVITGASRGLGLAMAEGLGTAGCNVVITDVSDTTDAVEELKSKDIEVMGLTMDVTNEDEITTMIDAVIDQFGRIDLLVNNAGILKQKPISDLQKEEWKQILEVNLTGMFLCARLVGKHMIEHKQGNIVNISSIAGLRGSAQNGAYGASKAGIISLTKTLAQEWAQHGIRVNAICPGVFITPMTEDLLKDEGFQSNIKNNVPLSRHAVPNELIGSIVYLTSEASSYVTGHALVVDGGWTAGL